MGGQFDDHQRRFPQPKRHRDFDRPTGDSAFVGSVVSAEVDPSVLPGLVVSSQDAARSAPEAGDAAPLLADTGEPDDWDAPVPGTGAGFSPVSPAH